jgi:hypothetical protein
LSPWGIPLLNTVILLTSGATITVCHHGIVWGAKKISVQYLGLTIGLAVFFILFQAFEYLNAPFTISDSVYGSIFFMTTGFHGFHVAIGTIYLIVCYFRLSADHFTRTHHIGFLGAAWYWHFVDVVWLFLFIVVYWFCGTSIELSSDSLTPDPLFSEYFFSLFYGLIYGIAVGQLFIPLIAFLGTYFFLSRNPVFKAFLKEVFLVWKEVPVLHKWPLFSFTMGVALPHRFWINNDIGPLGTMLITFVAIFLGSTVSLLFWAILAAFINMAVMNLVFVTCHQNSSTFRGVFYFVLFGMKDHSFAPQYFFFFFWKSWGGRLAKSCLRQ